jgi:hypothetical protein
VEFDIVYLFKINVDLNLFLSLSWPILVHCIIINGWCYVQTDRENGDILKSSKNSVLG